MAQLTREQALPYKHRIVVCGGRNYNDYPAFRQRLEKFLRMLGGRHFVIITGLAADGPDNMAMKWAVETGSPWYGKPADWSNLDKPGAVIRYRYNGEPYNVKAGFDRNLEMRDDCTHVLAFWDGESRGTEHMIKSAMTGENDIQVFVYMIEPDAGRQTQPRKNDYERQSQGS